MFTKMIGALGIAMALSSCATVIRGVHEHLKVVSNPSGADVTLSTGERGITPATFVKRRRNSFQVTVSNRVTTLKLSLFEAKPRRRARPQRPEMLPRSGSVLPLTLELAHGTRFIQIRFRFS